MASFVMKNILGQSPELPFRRFWTSVVTRSCLSCCVLSLPFSCQVFRKTRLLRPAARGACRARENPLCWWSGTARTAGSEDLHLVEARV